MSAFTSRDKLKTYIPAERTIPEMTLKALLVGALLSIVMGAANAYLGLYVGMTVSATIPAAVMTVALLRPLKANILEINIAKVATSAGESLAAGVIFTVPALVILWKYFRIETGWTEIHLLETALIALVGGVLGVLFTVTLRRALIIETDLPFPEGIAATAVLTTIVGDESKESKSSRGAGAGILMLFGAVIAGLFKFAQESLHIFKGNIEAAISIGKYKILGKTGEGVFYGGTALSPALLGVGYIVGPRIASFVLVGGLIGWVILIPLIILVGGMPTPAQEFTGLGYPLAEFYTVWSYQVRLIGVGAMVVGGLWTLFTLRSSLGLGIKKAIYGAKTEGKDIIRTQKDLNFKKTFLAIFLMIIPMFILYVWFSGLWAESFVFALIMLLVAFVGAAIAGYMAGLVGSSNNPISGVTVSVLLFTALVAVGMGIKGPEVYVIVIAVAAVACCAAAISGDVMQDLATGHMLGATPWKMQIAEMVGVIAVAPFLGVVIYLLDQAYHIGSTKLLAPQSFMMSLVVKGVVTGEMVWPYILMGAVIAFILILMDLPVLPVAIGVYLPFTLGAPIFVGGAVRHVVNRIVDKRVPPEKEEVSDWEAVIKKKGLSIRDIVTQRGLIMSAGLIAGEALMGVIVAILIVAGLDLSIGIGGADWPGLLIWLYIAVLLAYVVLRVVFVKKKQNNY